MGLLVSMPAASCYISSAEKHRVFPFLTLCCGPRMACAGLIAITWTVTSQSNSPRIAAVLLNRRFGHDGPELLDVVGDVNWLDVLQPEFFLFDLAQ